MFSQRKRFYEKKSFYGIILAFLLAFGLWINADTGSSEDEKIKEPAVNTGERILSDQTGSGNPSDSDNQSSYTGKYTQNEENKSGDPTGASDETQYGDWENGAGENDETAGAPAMGNYYLLKEDSGYIRLYSVSGAGEKELVRTTDISFSLLSEGDQELFKKGIIKQTNEELSDLLQDFES